MKTSVLISSIKTHLSCKEHKVKKELTTHAVNNNYSNEPYQALASCKVDFKQEPAVVYANEEQQQLLQRFNLPSQYRLEKAPNAVEGQQQEADFLPQLLGSITTYSEERNLALLFLDIRNFTSIMELHPAQSVLHIIKVLFLLFSKSIKENGGRIIETGGDSLYAVFGFDTDEQAAVRASVEASYSILDDLEKFNNAYSIPHFGLDIEIGIGLHEGSVVMSYSDLEEIGHLTVMGLPVNIAARLQAATKDLNNNIVISDQAYRFIDPNADDDDAVAIRLKGISTPVAVRMLGYSYHTIEVMA
jgi:adenylate cyclase